MAVTLNPAKAPPAKEEEDDDDDDVDLFGSDDEEDGGEGAGPVCHLRGGCAATREDGLPYAERDCASGRRRAR